MSPMRMSFARALAAALLVSATIGAQAASGAVSVGHSGWSWGSPVPQGNALTAVEFAAGRGYAAGAFGTLLRTDDGGATWTGIATGVTGPIARIRAVDADTVIVGSGCLLRRSDDGGQTFTGVRFTPSERDCPAGVTSFHFVTEQLGYLLLDNGTVFRTDNGGQAFTAKTAVPGTQVTGGHARATDIFFTGPDTGYTTVSAGNGVIYRTTDGGGSWVLNETAGRGLNGLIFADATTGYAVGNGNWISKTENGGATWGARSVPGDIPSADLQSVRCASAMTCLISTRTGERLLRTTDGADNITAVTPSTQKILAVAFASSMRAVGVGESGATVVSDDAGDNFAAVGDRVAGNFRRLRATDERVIHAAGDNGLAARSIDGGQTWSTIGVATSQNVADVSFPNQATGYGLDVAGAAQRTDDSGQTWAILDTGTSARPTAIHAVDTDTVLLFGPQGVRRSTDRGVSFDPIGGRIRRAGLFDFDRAGSALVTWGQKSMFVSENEGRSWRSIRRPGGRRDRLFEVDFVDARRGFALTADGRVWATSNAGRRWRELPATGTNLGFDLAFADGQNGYMAIGSERDPGYVLRTTDAGSSWRPQLISANRLAVDGLAAPSESTAFALAPSARLFGTRTGGDQGRDTGLTISTSTRSFRKSANVRIRGRLNPAVAGADVLVSAREASGRSWTTQLAPPVSTQGTFTVTFRVRRTTHFVAQWDGDADNNGDGSGVLTVRRRR